MEKVREVAGHLWRWYRGVPLWGQVAIGVVMLSVVVGPFLEEDDEDPKGNERAAASTTATSEPGSTSAGPTTTTQREEPGRVSETTFPEAWPLSVEQGAVRCVRGNSVIFVTDDRTIYALNGLARGRAEQEGWREIDEIWLDNPDLPGTKISIGPLIDLGLDLCT